MQCSMNVTGQACPGTPIVQERAGVYVCTQRRIINVVGLTTLIYDALSAFFPCFAAG